MMRLRDVQRKFQQQQFEKILVKGIRSDVLKLGDADVDFDLVFQLACKSLLEELSFSSLLPSGKVTETVKHVPVGSIDSLLPKQGKVKVIGKRSLTGAQAAVFDVVQRKGPVLFRHVRACLPLMKYGTVAGSLSQLVREDFLKKQGKAYVVAGAF